MSSKQVKPEETPSMSWKAQVARAYLKVPRTFQELAWRSAVAGFALVAGLTGTMLWKNPGIIFGKPAEQQSLIQRLAAHADIKGPVFELMERFYYRHRPEGLMLIAWEELESLTGIWVRPADDFPGKAGVHHLTPDMRELVGPFVFGECGTATSISKPNMIMVACPIITSYDVWGYVAVVVEESEAETYERLVRFLAHRITELVY